MSSAVAELEAGLQGMLALKPPGVSGSRITNITALCVANVQSESVLIQKIFTHFKRTPGTHKLGVLYVVDSVTRKWMDQAKAQGQPIGMSAQDGTFAAGVYRVTELMPMLMNDIIVTAPEDQKEKIKKLVDIWDKGQTFPPSMVNSFKEKLSAPRPQNDSTTPPGSPPPNLLGTLASGSARLAAPPPPPPAMPNIMETLANIARQNATTAQSNPSLSAPAPVSAHHNPMFSPVGGLPSNGALQRAQQVPVQTLPQPGMPFLPTSQPAVQPVNVPSALNYAFPPPPQAPAAPAPALLNGGASNPAAAFNPTNPTVQLVAALVAQGMPIDKITSVIQMMGQGGAAPAAPLQQVAQPAQAPYGGPSSASGQAPWETPRADDPRDRNGFHDGLRSPNRPRGRSRSRSPRGWDVHASPRGRGNDRGFEYGRVPSPTGRPRPDERERDRGRGGRMPEYRQRSPPGRRAQSPPARGEAVPEEKWVDYDTSIPSGCIKVYSRTLFVGGVTCSDNELRQIFDRFGQVQTCIVNKDKRHAFVKMFYRKDAEAAKNAMEGQRNQDLQLRTRWGVGFGPRDCSDYQSGISIIPITKLTDADRKWMLTAPYGGSGGRPIQTGLSVEEPDIEIGAGVSSKAISRRMQTDKGGNHGPKSSRRDDDAGPSPDGQGNDLANSHDRGERVERGGGSGGGGGRWRHGRDRHRNHSGHNGDGRRDDRNDRMGGNDDPIVMDLPAGITMGPNGINYPPNFAFGTASH
ncbi:hypothetical protein B0T26DRAFT_655373 [Lasiosphaeria miniovina]|uniref:Rpb7-binding protein seb1 n=1 Tax=Lasiosphaeria miniovina TaxID=1954250 RepID=A0AA40A070_9PEZI|nr:uncharacterized protein B0T26DRAFT_655373 [Lasiosphaeria miniovina]KAK0706858.1 hypothetical protein B0T26DRAFT_655373 [Lasiosphaeria miniovina]